MAFSFYSPVTVNTGQVPSTQTNFPILINYIDNRFKTVTGHVQNANGYDIRPYSDSGLTTSLTYELERYNSSTGEVVMWVKRSSLADGNVTYLAYGDGTLTTDGSDGANTFSNSFRAVYHLKDGTTLSMVDSVAALNLTNENTVTAVAGQIDGGAGFVSTSSQDLLFGGGGINPGGAFTYSAWIKATSFPNAYNTITTVTGAGEFEDLFVKSNGKLACYLSTPAKSYDGTGSHTLSTATWYLLHFVYNSSVGLIGYVNAASDGTDTAGTAATAIPDQLYIGKDGINAGRFWNGSMDEVRIATVVRSADWITTEYNNQSAPSTFATLGTEVAIGGVFGTLFGM